MRVTVQIRIEGTTSRPCPHCQRPRAIKGCHPLRFRTAFGDIDLRSPRWRRCRCEQSREATFCPLSELLTVHTSPELTYLQAKWAAQVSFAAVGALLHDVLPVDQGLRPETIRRHVLETAERLEAQLGPEEFAYDGGSQREIEASPKPAAPDHGKAGRRLHPRTRAPARSQRMLRGHRRKEHPGGRCGQGLRFRSSD